MVTLNIIGAFKVTLFNSNEVSKLSSICAVGMLPGVNEISSRYAGTPKIISSTHSTTVPLMDGQYHLYSVTSLSLFVCCTYEEFSHPLHVIGGEV